MRHRVVPVDLGGPLKTCAISPPRTPPPTVENVLALVHHYRAERLAPGQELEVAFFRGGLPDAQVLAACHPLAMRVACSPADLSTEDARLLADAGVGTLELDALTFDDEVLRGLDRGYRARRVRLMVEGLRVLGFRLGLTLSPGLPGLSHAASLADAEAAADVDFVRIYPALALEGSALAASFFAGLWRPPELEVTLATVAAMVERLEAAGVEIARIGLQPRQDVPGRAVAGPWHPNLRGLVQARRFRNRIADALTGLCPDRGVVLRVHPRDLSEAKGPEAINLRDLRAHYGFAEIRIVSDPTLARGRVVAEGS